MRRVLVVPLVLVLFLTSITTAACSSETKTPSPRLAEAGQVRLRILLPDGPEDGLVFAARDLLEAVGEITGAAIPQDAVGVGDVAQSAGVPLLVHVDAKESAVLGPEGYVIYPMESQPGLEVVAATRMGAMYGLYRIAWDLGVRYIHPEETFFPENTELSVPTVYNSQPDIPGFAHRGFHEHTQHPIPASDFLLRPGRDDFRAMASRYLRWLARNRQNVVTFHMLKTVDLEQWLPYMTDIVGEAKLYGIHMGPLIGFADQQQNAFKLVNVGATDEVTGEALSEDEQIRRGIDLLLQTGFTVLGFQVGSSEFTMIPEATILGWLDVMRQHLAQNYPQVRPYIWIHITCDLEIEDGTPYYHLPLRSDPSVGAYVHTTMFYTLEHPAPVYSCQDFSHQLDFLEEGAAQRRPQVFFPESAWWLGFDNNMPLVLPITGWSREYDVREVLPRYEDAEYKIHGHATFTTGREWTFWQYDHYIAQLTWDRDLTWDQYLDSIPELYGTAGSSVASVLKEWTRLQQRHFYDENPEIFFYLAGELPQDELGLMSGILARRPKIPFPTILNMEDAAFDQWKVRDFDMLVRMKGEYQAILDELAPLEGANASHQQKLYAEVRDSLYIYVRRIEHAIALYDAVAEARRWYIEARRETPDESLHADALAAAEMRLSEARGITTEISALLLKAEERYRYPLEILTARKPESLTAYKIGYLHETSTAYFWTRRDDQLAMLLDEVFGTTHEEWGTQPDWLVRSTADTTTMVEPDDPFAAAVLAQFIPAILWGLKGDRGGEPALVIGQDYNQTRLPDPGTEAVIQGQVDDGVWTGTAQEYALVVRDASGAKVGMLNLIQPQFQLDLLTEQGVVVGAGTARIEAEVLTQTLIDIVVTVTVGGIDEEGVSNILKDVFGLDPSQPLPQRLPIGFVFGLQESW
jgi:hypothetical protein